MKKTTLIAPPTAPAPDEDKAEPVQLHIQTILATLTEVNLTLGRRYGIVKGQRGSWMLRAAGIMDAMELVEGMRQRIITDVVAAVEKKKEQDELAKTKPADLPPGLLVLTPEEVKARETSVPETAED